ncbi:hypothetical protein TREMEDRAFT_65259 [Tremella mesenterica DSM 1558]|uniref:uncharacterized protein n=1 Tax=Tremella mesenterica (strain ATCC 24925 / CBS 8224 / DSM 1558 / NBRC 9311 / NRRL Y-6157 / RJB 2259-6 / UBC 559-6) TaxID=578456 RepID=UPI00032BF2EC|nr:uncharacterized protein TREMEDRAFT_65259 [Tremella mesenterica DSM 1558]EIW66851.1 hypothetical protein TREMEDRAFT_65259 [Tremella mesenterica DSM 1558]
MSPVVPLAPVARDQMDRKRLGRVGVDDPLSITPLQRLPNVTSLQTVRNASQGAVLSIRDVARDLLPSLEEQIVGQGREMKSLTKQVILLGEHNPELADCNSALATENADLIRTVDMTGEKLQTAQEKIKVLVETTFELKNQLETSEKKQQAAESELQAAESELQGSKAQLVISDRRAETSAEELKSVRERLGTKMDDLTANRVELKDRLILQEQGNLRHTLDLLFFWTTDNDTDIYDLEVKVDHLAMTLKTISETGHVRHQVMPLIGVFERWIELEREREGQPDSTSTSTSGETLRVRLEKMVNEARDKTRLRIPVELKESTDRWKSSGLLTENKVGSMLRYLVDGGMMPSDRKSLLRDPLREFVRGLERDGLASGLNRDRMKEMMEDLGEATSWF